MKKQLKHSKENTFSIVFPILTIVLIGIVTVIITNYEPKWDYNWTDIRTEIKDSIQVSESRGITSGVGGMGISTKNEVDRRKWIMKNATNFELQKLTKYPNGNVKAIAYEGLLRKKNFSQRTELTLKAIRDTTYLVNYQSGCLGWDIEIGKYLIQNVLMIDDKAPLFSAEDRIRFDLTQLDKEKILIEYRKRSGREY